jgi:hypothetical protein
LALKHFDWSPAWKRQREEGRQFREEEAINNQQRIMQNIDIYKGALHISWLLISGNLSVWVRSFWWNSHLHLVVVPTG